MNDRDMAAALELAADLGARGGIVRRLVGELVHLHGLVEVASDAACGWCAAPLEQPAGGGRPRKWCSPRCRKAASRSRNRDEMGQ